MTSKHSPLIIAVLLLFVCFFFYILSIECNLSFFPDLSLHLHIYYELHLKKQHELEDKEEIMRQSI